MLTQLIAEFCLKLIFVTFSYLENEPDISNVRVHSTQDLVQGSTPAARDTPGTVLYVGRMTCKTTCQGSMLRNYEEKLTSLSRNRKNQRLSFYAKLFLYRYHTEQHDFSK
jgi:hypothetical protein